MKLPLLLLASLAEALAATHGPGVVEAGSITVDVPDTDGDGCNDYVEQNIDTPHLGGARDADNAWDFFDVTGDRIVDIRDIQRVAYRFGVTAGTPLYGSTFDRQPTGSDPWDLGAGDGTISTADIAAAVTQFGHVCEGPFSKGVDLTAECNGIVKEVGEPEEQVELDEGESHVECVLVRNPDTAEVIDISKTEISNLGAVYEGEAVESEPLLEPPSGGAGSPGKAIPLSVTTWGYYRCEAQKKVESLNFRTDLAKLKVILRWKGVIDSNNPYYKVVVFREVDKDVAAVWPWSVINRNDQIDHWYPDYPWAYKAKTWSSFKYDLTIPVPGPLPDIGLHRYMEIHVSTEAHVHNGQGWCHNSGYTT